MGFTSWKMYAEFFIWLFSILPNFPHPYLFTYLSVVLHDEGEGWVGEWIVVFSPFLPSPPAASMSKTNMAGWINDRELLKVKSNF